jgi:hypothetical protein
VFGQAGFPNLQITSTGTYNFGIAGTLGADAQYSDKLGLAFASTSGGVWNPSSSAIENNGTFNWRGGVIDIGTGPILMNANSVTNIPWGTVITSGGWFRPSGTTQSSLTLNIGRLRYAIRQGVTTECSFSFNATQNANFILNNLEIYGTRLFIGETDSGVVNLLNFSYKTTTGNYVLSLRERRKVVLTNALIGTATAIRNDGSGPNGYIAEVFKQVQPRLLNSAGAGISNVVVYIRDTNNGQRRNATDTGFALAYRNVDYTADRVYTGATDATGKPSVFNVLTGVIVNQDSYGAQGTINSGANRIDRRGIGNNSSDNFDLHYWSYGNIYAKQTLSMLGFNTSTPDWTLFADSNVTLTEANAITKLASSFTVNTATNTITVTANSTLDDLYDVMKVYKTRNVQAQLEYPTISTQPVTASGNIIETAMNIVINAGVTLEIGSKFIKLITTGTVTNNGTISGTYTDASGTRVAVRTSDNLALSTEILINGVPQGWQTGQTARNIFVQSNSVVRIYAHAYGYQPKIINIVGNTASDYIISLVPETNVDTTQSNRDTIAAAFGNGIDANSRIFLSVNADLRTYTPAQVLHALHWHVLNNGSLIALAALAAGDLNGFALQRGGYIVRTPGFYGKIADSVTTVSNVGILVPLAISVDPNVFVTMPTYTPVEKNTSGHVLQFAPWTQQEADVPSWVAKQSSLTVINQGVQMASNIIPHTTNL